MVTGTVTSRSRAHCSHVGSQSNHVGFWGALRLLKRGIVSIPEFASKILSCGAGWYPGYTPVDCDCSNVLYQGTALAVPHRTIGFPLLRENYTIHPSVEVRVVA